MIICYKLKTEGGRGALWLERYNMHNNNNAVDGSDPVTFDVTWVRYASQEIKIWLNLISKAYWQITTIIAFYKLISSRRVRESSQRSINAGSASSTLSQHWLNVGSVPPGLYLTLKNQPHRRLSERMRVTSRTDDHIRSWARQWGNEGIVVHGS